MRSLDPRRMLFRLGGALTGVMALVVTTALPAAAELTLTPSSGPHGTEVTASGSSTKPGGLSCRTVEVFFDATRHSDGHVVNQGTRVASDTCDIAGRYSVSFTVPGNTARGPKQVLVAGKDAIGQLVSEEVAVFTVTGPPKRPAGRRA